MAKLDSLTTEQKTSLNSTLSGLSTNLKGLQQKFGSDATLRSINLQPAKDFELQQPTPNTKSAGLLGGIETFTGTDKFTQDVNRDKNIATANAGAAFEQYLDRLANGKTKTGIEAEVFAQDGGVDDLQVELDDINAQIMAEQHSLRRELEELDKNKEGLFGGALDDKKARVNRESLRKQADLSIIQMARQGRFDSAKQIADRLVDAEFEREENITEAVKLNYEVNKELFTTAEQRAFETNLGNRERTLSQQREDAKQLSDTKLSALSRAQANGAPLDIIKAIQGATTPESVLTAGGKWATADLLAQEQQRASIAASNTSRLLSLGKAGDSSAIKALGFDPREPNTTIEKLDATTKRQLENQMAGSNELIDLATQYRDLIEKRGFTNTVFGSSDALGEVDALRTAMTAAYKEAKALGALDTGVQTLVEGVIGQEPTSGFFTFGRNITGRKSNRIVSSLDTLIETTSVQRDKAIARLGYTPLGDPVTFGLSQEEDAEINSMFGLGGQNATTASFAPSKYFKQ